MVPEAGLEPARYCYRRILNPVRLPIPPLWLRAYESKSHQIGSRTLPNSAL